MDTSSFSVSGHQFDRHIDEAGQAQHGDDYAGDAGGLDRGLGDENCASSYDDLKAYTPAWAEKITGVSRAHIIRTAREFADNADKTHGRSMIIVGAGLNHWFHLDMNYRGLINMLIFCGSNIMAQSVNTTVLDGIFCAGGDSKFDMKGNLGAMWCFSVPFGFFAAFVLKWPVMVVYCIVNLDEIVKIPAVYLHYKKYIWVRNITVQEDA